MEGVPETLPSNDGAFNPYITFYYINLVTYNLTSGRGIPVVQNAILRSTFIYLLRNNLDSPELGSLINLLLTFDESITP